MTQPDAQDSQGSAPATDSLEREVAFVSGLTGGGAIAPRSFATWNDDDPATYAAQAQQFKWGAPEAGLPGGSVTYAFAPPSNWTPAERRVFVAGLTLWSDEANISFVPVSIGQTPDVVIRRNSNGDAYENDVEGPSAIGSRSLPNPSAVAINIDSSSRYYGPIDHPFAFDAFPLSTVVHEEGHVLGLGHTGPYNGGTLKSTEAAQLGPYDQQLYSVMSYIPPGDTAAPFYDSYPTQSKFANAETPMTLDILAAQRLYGAPTTTALSGGQTFGFDCNITDASRMFFDFSVNKQPVVTLYDTGTGNTLDLSGFSSKSWVDLSPGAFSSCDGMTNNITVAYGTAINSVICGSGNDTITGTTGSDTITGGAGNDTMTGYGGQDTFVFSAGSGQDLITDFSAVGPDQDTLNFHASQFASVADLLHHTSMLNGSAVIHAGPQDSVMLQNVTKVQLETHPHDFRFG